VIIVKSTRVTPFNETRIIRVSDPSAKYGSEDPEWNSPGKDEFELDAEITATENKEEIIEKAKAGWTTENAGRG
jgi:hypothetical protein